MKCIKLLSALFIILTVAIAPTSGVFAQSDVRDTETTKVINKEQRIDKLVIRGSEIENTAQSLEFKGKAEGWAIINGQAVSATIDLSGKADKATHGWKLTGTGIVKIADRNVSFDLQ